MTRLHLGWLLVVSAAVLAAGCSKKEESSVSSAASPGVSPVTMETMIRGARMYQEHCAQCHGPEAQGHPDWENPAVAAAPPLNGTGNDWKRKKSELVGTIKNGVTKNKVPLMPAWKDRLKDEEIEDILTWLQALWPDNTYEVWRKANATPDARKGVSRR
jgi:mono/diheme cytochrome c family protein